MMQSADVIRLSKRYGQTLVNAPLRTNAARVAALTGEWASDGVAKWLGRCNRCLVGQMPICHTGLCPRDNRSRMRSLLIEDTLDLRTVPPRGFERRGPQALLCSEGSRALDPRQASRPERNGLPTKVTVSGSGTGVSPSLCRRPFQSSATKTGDISATGVYLDLTILRAIALSLGGRITLDI
jgi:hypothetical protein